MDGELVIPRLHQLENQPEEEHDVGGLVYSADELAEWVPKIRRMQENASEVHLVVNTNNRDQAIVNARLPSGMLGEGSRKGG